MLLALTLWCWRLGALARRACAILEQQTRVTAIMGFTHRGMVRLFISPRNFGHAHAFQRSGGMPGLMKEQAAVDVVCLAGDEAGLLGGQEADHMGDVLGLSDAPQRGGLPRFFDDLGPKLFQ